MTLLHGHPDSGSIDLTHAIFSRGLNTDLIRRRFLFSSLPIIPPETNGFPSFLFPPYILNPLPKLIFGAGFSGKFRVFAP